MPYTGKDFDIKLKAGGTTKTFRLLQQRGRKLWAKREMPPSPRPEEASTREGQPPERLMSLEQRDWMWGVGLSKLTPQADRPGHVLRYSDGFGIDTSEVGRVKHGPAFLPDVGTLDEVPSVGLMHGSAMWFLTPTYLYSYDAFGTLTKEWTNPDGDHNTRLVSHGGSLFIATTDAKYWHTTGSPVGGPITVTAVAESATGFQSLGNQLWRWLNSYQISSSVNPTDAPPTWSTPIDVGDGATISTLFSISGLLGVATTNTLYIIDSDNDSIELSKVLRSRASGLAYSIKAESGSDVWFADKTHIQRLVAEGFEVFDIRLEGPRQSTDIRPVDETAVILLREVALDLEAVYVACQRSTDLYIYKGVEIARGIYAWSPLLKYADKGSAIDFMAVGKLNAGYAPDLFFNDGATVKRINLAWDEYTDTWELHTPYLSGGLEEWTKIAWRVRAYLEREANTSVTVYYRKDDETSWTQFSSDTMTTNGNNEVNVVSSPVVFNRIQLRFVGATTNSANKVDLRSYEIESILRPDYHPVFDMTLIAENSADVAFLESLREVEGFVTLTDRFNTAHEAFVLPGYPIGAELEDEARHSLVRAYQLVCQEVS